MFWINNFQKVRHNAMPALVFALPLKSEFVYFGTSIPSGSSKCCSREGMFSTKERLRKKTPASGIGREEYIEHLVDEFHASSDIEAQEQVSANLANFAYDPINYPFLRKSNCIELFLQVISLSNERLVLHGIAGICNLCLDDYFKSVIVAPSNLQAVTSLLTKENTDIVLQTLTTLSLLSTPETKDLICTRHVVKEIQRLRESKHIPIRRLANVFIEDNCTKTEIIQL